MRKNLRLYYTPKNISCLTKDRDRKLWIRVGGFTVYTRISFDIWRHNSKGNFKGVASYTRYNLSVCTAGPRYAVEQTIHSLTLIKLASGLQRSHYTRLYTVHNIRQLFSFPLFCSFFLSFTSDIFICRGIEYSYTRLVGTALAGKLVSKYFVLNFISLSFVYCIKLRFINLVIFDKYWVCQNIEFLNSRHSSRRHVHTCPHSLLDLKLV